MTSASVDLQHNSHTSPNTKSEGQKLKDEGKCKQQGRRSVCMQNSKSDACTHAEGECKKQSRRSVSPSESSKFCFAHVEDGHLAQEIKSDVHISQHQ